MLGTIKMKCRYIFRVGKTRNCFEAQILILFAFCFPICFSYNSINYGENIFVTSGIYPQYEAILLPVKPCPTARVKCYRHFWD
jgi:hypothetical protein